MRRAIQVSARKISRDPATLTTGMCGQLRERAFVANAACAKQDESIAPARRH